MTVRINSLAPDFTLPSSSGEEITLSKLTGKRIVLYFYPKDCTSGCTLEAQEFRDAVPAFKKLNTIIFGVSRDSLKSHHKFISAQQLNFELLSDVDEQVCQLYEVIKNKNMYGKTVRGIERSTFLINEKSEIIYIWRGVKVNGHIQAILAILKNE